jgi:hypothetical protein
VSEHRTNARAQVASAGGRQLGVEIMIAMAPKENILILPPDKVRTIDGRTEVMGVPPARSEAGWGPGTGEPAWHVPPPDAEVVVEGAVLGPDKLDLVVNLVATAVGGMVDGAGRVMGRRRHLRELFREDAQQFLATLGAGGSPS